MGFDGVLRAARAHWWLVLATFVVTLGCAGLLTTRTMPQYATTATFFVSTLTESGAVLVAIGLLSDGRRRPLLGHSRLMIGALGLALLVVISRRLGVWALKAVVVLASAPILSAFGNMRKEAVQANHPDMQLDATGLESVASPLDGYSWCPSRASGCGPPTVFWRGLRYARSSAEEHYGDTAPRSLSWPAFPTWPGRLATFTFTARFDMRLMVLVAVLLFITDRRTE